MLGPASDGPLRFAASELDACARDPRDRGAALEVADRRLAEGARSGVGDHALHAQPRTERARPSCARARGSRAPEPITPSTSGRRSLSISNPYASAIRSTSRTWFSVSSGRSSPGRKTASADERVLAGELVDQRVAHGPAEHRQPGGERVPRSPRTFARRRAISSTGKPVPLPTRTTFSSSTYGMWTGDAEGDRDDRQPPARRLLEPLLVVRRRARRRAPGRARPRRRAAPAPGRRRRPRRA